MSQPTDHTSIARGTYSDAWGTPAQIIDHVRDTYGEIDVDLASNDGAQWRTVRARAYYTVDRPCPNTLPEADGLTVWCNPPGPCKRVKEFWRTWCDAVQRGARGGFLIFKQDHWRQLQTPTINLVCVVLRKRIAFNGAYQSASFPSTLVLTPHERVMDLWLPHGHIVEWRANPNQRGDA